MLGRGRGVLLGVDNLHSGRRGPLFQSPGRDSRSVPSGAGLGTALRDRLALPHFLSAFNDEQVGTERALSYFFLLKSLQ